VDFERDDLGTRLATCGFRPDEPAFFFWLGVVPYLSRDAIASVLRFVAAVPGSEIVFDYAEPLANRTPAERARAEALAERVSHAGEPILSWFGPAELHAELRQLGFGEIEDLDGTALVSRFMQGLNLPRFAGGHVLRAGVCTYPK
jgi:methyltransferase (TIGR00027 family)